MLGAQSTADLVVCKFELEVFFFRSDRHHSCSYHVAAPMCDEAIQGCAANERHVLDSGLDCYRVPGRSNRKLEMQLGSDSWVKVRCWDRGASDHCVSKLHALEARSCALQSR